MALKKEFTEEKIQRMRNLIQGKYHDATTISSGYSKKEVDHKKVMFGRIMGKPGL